MGEITSEEIEEQESGTQTEASRDCPHDGSPLIPLAGTPHWFHCGAEGWKHYFYQTHQSEGGDWIDVDTNEVAWRKTARPRGRPPGQPATRPPRPPKT